MKPAQRITIQPMTTTPAYPVVDFAKDMAALGAIILAVGGVIVGLIATGL